MASGPSEGAAKLASGIVLFVGFGAFGVLAWAWRRIAVLGRPWDAGDVVVLGVFGAFGLACLWWSWQLFRGRAEADATARPQGPDSPAPTRRARLSHAFAAGGVLLLILAVLVPAAWGPVLLLFAGIACLVVSHVLTPCEERMERLRKARASMRQL